MTEEKCYQSKYRMWEEGKFAPPPEKPLSPVQPDSINMVAMRDGVKLYTEIFLSGSHEASPVILVRSPYPFSRPSRSDKRPISRYLEAGYNYVFQLTRGQGKSEGNFQYLSDDINDGYDIISWLTEQPWCNGKVGMEGASYLGSTQLMAAKSKPSALKCIMPTAFVGNSTQCFPFSYGVPNKAPYMQWMQVLDAESWDDMDVAYGDMSALDHPKWGAAFRKRPLVEAADGVISGDKLENWRKAISHPIDDVFWKKVHFTDQDLAELTLPMFITDGFYDMSIGPIDFFQRLEKIDPNNPDRYLLVGPWDHYQTASRSLAGENNGDRTLPKGAEMDHMDHRLKFFNRYLKDDYTVKVQRDRVRVYVSGAETSDVNRWFDFPTFPAPGTDLRKFFLHSDGLAQIFPSDGSLSFNEPGDEPCDSYVYDPSVPTYFQVETSQDRRQVEIRSDVLTYTSKILEKPITILGDVTLILHAASDCPDTDWIAVLTEVYPDGQSKSCHYAPPAFRARYREGFDKEVFLESNKPEKFCISIGPIGHQIAAGNRLRLSIFSSAFPEYEPNSNTGNEAAYDVESRIATQTIFHNTENPSHLVLPIYTVG